MLTVTILKRPLGTYSLLGTREIQQRQLELELATQVKFSPLTPASILSLARDNFTSASTLPVKETSPLTNTPEETKKDERVCWSPLHSLHTLNFLTSEHEKENSCGTKPESDVGLPLTACLFWARQLTPLRQVSKTCDKKRWWCSFAELEIRFVNTPTVPVGRHPLNVHLPSLHLWPCHLTPECTHITFYWSSWVVLNSHEPTSSGDSPCSCPADAVTRTQP